MMAQAGRGGRIRVHRPAGTPRVAGRERIISPADAVWDSFFLGGSNIPTDDFMNERASQAQPAREVERMPGLLSENGL